MASSYGWPLKEIGNLTIGQLLIFHSAILKRKKQEMIFHASCVGATIEDKDSIENKKPRLSEKQLEAIKRSSEERHQAMGLKKYEFKSK